MKNTPLNRRRALAGLGSLAAGSALLKPASAAENVSIQNNAPKMIGEPPGRITPAGDLANILECEEAAARSIAPKAYAQISGGDRSFFERITFRPRMMVPTTGMDQSVELFGLKMFSPIIVGPIAKQQQYHPDGELATARGATAARALMVVSNESSVPIDKIAAEAKAGFWFQVFPEGDLSAVKSSIQQAVKAGAKAICITVGASHRNMTAALSAVQLAKMPAAALNWGTIDQLRQGASVPVILKGVMTPEEADLALQHGIQGIVVSNYGGILAHGMVTAPEVLPSIVDKVNGRVPVLVDGGFRRGSDVFKALAMGAKAVMVGRPAMWGLAAYGADGVQTVVEMFQTEVGRDMGHAGTPNMQSVGRSHIKIHEV